MQNTQGWYVEFGFRGCERTAKARPIRSCHEPERREPAGSVGGQHQSQCVGQPDTAVYTAGCARVALTAVTGPRRLPERSSSRRDGRASARTATASANAAAEWSSSPHDLKAASAPTEEMRMQGRPDSGCIIYVVASSL